MSAFKKIKYLFVVGDNVDGVGIYPNQDKELVCQTIEEQLKKENANSTLLYLGDNIYPKGLPDTNPANERLIAEEKLLNQLKLSQNFKGKTIFDGCQIWKTTRLS